MPAQVRFSRLDVTDRFPMVSLKIRDEGRPSQAEVAIGTDPALFTPEGKKQRNAANFYSTRGNGAVPFTRDEANYFVPPEVLARFIGNEKLYFGVATAGQGGAMKVAVMPTEASPYISIKGLSGRSMARVRVIPNRQQRASGYGRNSQHQLEWAGDSATPGMTPVANGGAGAPAANGKTNGGPAPVPAPYDDGFGPMPGATAPAAAPAAQGHTLQRARGLDLSDDPEARGIEGPAYSEAASYTARGLSVPTPDYPGAARFAASPAFNAGRSGQAIDRIVIHITDAPTTNSTVNHFTAPGAQASAHYLVGQDGEVVQFVAEANTAWHARGANSRGVGIEHVAIKQGGVDYPRANGTMQHFDHLPPSDTQYCESAALVSYLCDKYGLTPDRTTIIGHREADPRTTHTSCPDGAWNWDHFMDLVINRYCAAQPAAAAAQGLSVRPRNGGRYKPVAQAMVVGLEDKKKARKYGGPYRELFQWPVPKSVVSAIEARGFKVQTIDAAIGDLNLDRYPVEITRFPSGWDAPSLLQHFIRNINQFIDTDLCEFMPYDDSDAQTLASSSPKGTVLKIDMLGPDNAAVVISAAEPQFYIVSTINTPWSGDHPVSGHRQFGYTVENGKTTFYARGADRATLGFPGTETAIFYGGEKLWQGFQRRLAAFINDNGGAAEIIEPFSERFNATAMRQEFGRYDAQSLATARAMSGGAFTVNWDEGELVPQPTNFSCWAAAGAMLAGWRDRVSLSPDTVAQVCSRSTAKGLLTNDNEKFAAEMGFIAEPPVCYSEEGFRTLLENNGPLWVSEGVPPNLHAIIVTGMYSDGNNTFVRIADPWDRIVGTPGKPGGYAPTHTTGSRYIMSWDDFTRQYEAAVTGNPPNRQILHSGNPNGLAPNTGETSPPPGYAMRANGTAPNSGDGKGGAPVGEVRLPPPPPPRARGMSATAAAEVSIAGAPVETVHGSQGNVSWEIDHFHGPKHPGNVAPAGRGAYSDAPTIRLDQWPVLDNQRGATSAWFTIDWLYDGRSIGDVRINNAGVKTGATTLVVQGQIMDDNTLHPPNDCAALKIRLIYRFSTEGTPDLVAITDVRLYGDGTHEIASQWAESNKGKFSSSSSLVSALDKGGGKLGAVKDVLDIITGPLQSQGSVKWQLDKFDGEKHPYNKEPEARGVFKQAPTIRIRNWDRGWISGVGADFDIDWQYDGQSVGPITLKNVDFNTSILNDLVVSGTIAHDNIVYDNRDAKPIILNGKERPLMFRDGRPALSDSERMPCAAMRVRFEFDFTKTLPTGFSKKGAIDIILFGDGTHVRHGRWL